MKNYRDQALDNQGSLSSFWQATSYKHMTVAALFPTLTLWYLSIKVLALSEKKKKEKKDYLRRVWMLMTQAVFFFFAIKMQTKNLALAQNARILPASPLHLRHSNSSAIPKAQKKARTHTNTTWKQIIFRIWVQLEHYAPTLSLNKFTIKKWCVLNKCAIK